MQAGDRWNQLRQIAADQFGLFTAHQARVCGVRRYELARKADAGLLWRAHHGIYAFSDESARKHPYEDWAAQWLALLPGGEISERRAAPDAIVSHQSAAQILELGTIVSHSRLHLSGPRRINVRAQNVSAHRCQVGLQGADWELVDGLPVATAARVIDDLTAACLDGSHLGIAIEDALQRGLADIDDVHARLNRHARAWNADSGAELTRRLLMATGAPVSHIGIRNQSLSVSSGRDGACTSMPGSRGDGTIDLLTQNVSVSGVAGKLLPASGR
ncbi:type IV toxin-antitoxin system AbiEi family antitoxin domain-containing protein [Mycobacteroides abscessus]|uniref:type IV toxin-antitoxin system AbiEi family antitoxin domain-containing protein n=1 Tax=Mycobacteroides abscessus TaxID=36809 RepID=UPI000D6AFF73